MSEGGLSLDLNSRKEQPRPTAFDGGKGEKMLRAGAEVPCLESTVRISVRPAVTGNRDRKDDSPRSFLFFSP